VLIKGSAKHTNIMTDKHLSDTRFTELDIHADVLKGIESTGFEF